MILPVMVVFSGCSWNRNRLKVDITGISIPEVKVLRYDLDLFRTSQTNLKNDLEKIKHQYYFFLGTDLNDPKKLDEMKSYLENPRNIDFRKACDNKFRDISRIEKDLTSAFRHWKYYFPQARIPRVYTYISGGDYENPVQLADSVMIIALDNYLGKDFKPYFTDGVPLYKAERMTEEHIVPDCAKEIVNKIFPENPAAMTLLEGMVESGKRLYMAEALIPDIPEYLTLNYTRKQYDWVRKNESHVWRSAVCRRGEIPRFDAGFSSLFSL